MESPLEVPHVAEGPYGRLLAEVRCGPACDDGLFARCTGKGYGDRLRWWTQTTRKVEAVDASKAAYAGRELMAHGGLAFVAAVAVYTGLEAGVAAQCTAE